MTRIPTITEKETSTLLCNNCPRPATSWVEWLQRFTSSCDSVDCINAAIQTCEKMSDVTDRPEHRPFVDFCKCCRGKGWFLKGETDLRCPGCQNRKCERCDETEGVSLEDSRTMYDPGPLTFWDRIRLDGEEPEDPNRPRWLCRECATDHHAFWDEQWREYYSGLL